MSKLYEITNEMMQIEKLLCGGELTADELKDTIEALGIEYKQKVESILKIRLFKLDDAASIDREIERLTELRKPILNDVKHLEDYVKGSMVATSNDKLDLGLFKLTLRKPTKNLGAIDESKVPAEYWTEVPATKKLDKRGLLAAVKETEIEGVELIDSERSLTIK